MWLSRNAESLGPLSRFPVPPVPFPAALALSLALHLLLAAAWLTLPSGERGAPFPIYRVRLVAAPPRPEARRLDVAREAPSALAAAPGRAVARPLAVPQVELPGAIQPLPPEAPGRPGEPGAPAQTALAPAPALPQRQRAQAAPVAPVAPVAPRSPLSQQAAPMPQAQVPALPPTPMARSLEPPRAPAAEEEAPQAPLASVPRPPSEPGQARAPAPPGGTGALEDVRRMVGEQAAISREAPRAAPEAPQANPLAELARRRYRGGIQTRVQENYNYPGNFTCGTQARGQITIARDGSVLAWELLESSGDERFDYALNLTIRATKFQPLPDEIPGESVQERINFVSKNCTRRDTQ